MLTAENSSLKCSSASVFLSPITSKPTTSRQTGWPWQRADYCLVCASYRVLLPLFSLLAELFLIVCQEHFLPQKAIIYIGKELNHLRYLHEPVSFFLSSTLRAQHPTLGSGVWRRPKSPSSREPKRGKTAFAKGLKHFRVSRNCRAPHVAFAWNSWHKKGQGTSKHTWGTKELWQENALLILFNLDHLCALCKEALWKNKTLPALLLFYGANIVRTGPQFVINCLVLLQL